jgi:DNA-binding protein YbaB
MPSPPQDLRDTIDRWRAASDRVRAADASARAALVEGSDPRGAVAVRIDERWRVVAVRLRNTWRDVLEPDHLGAAVVQAVADAVQERLRPAIELLIDVDALPGRASWAAMAADDPDLAAEPGHLRGLAPVTAPDLHVDVVESQLARADRVLARQSATPARPPNPVGRSRRHEVEIELGLVGLPVRVDCRPDWLRETSVDRLTSALAEAFVEAYAVVDDLEQTSVPIDGAA